MALQIFLLLYLPKGKNIKDGKFPQYSSYYLKLETLYFS